MSRKDLADTFASVRLLRGAEAAFFDRLAQQPRAKLSAKAGESIFEGGDPADAIFVAFPAEASASAPRGIVELSLPTNDAGGQAHMEHIVAGDVFGEFELVAAGLGGGRVIRRSSARAVVAIDLYRVPFSLLAPLLAESEAVRARLIKLSFDRLTTALNVRSAQLQGDRDGTFADWLVDAAENIGIAEGRHVRFSRTIGQREIAEALGVTRETMSLRLNEWERAGLLNTGGQSQRLEILDYPRVALRAALHREPPQDAILAATAEIDADLSRGDLVRARNVGLDALALFPSSPDLRHRVALANIRAGNVRESLAGLAHGGYATGADVVALRTRVRLGLTRPDVAPGRLFFNSEDGIEEGDPEDVPDFDRRLNVLTEDLAAIEARAQKELAFAAADPTARARHAAVSADYYAAIHEAVGGTYAGVNAAMMARIAGEADRSSAIAARVIRQVGHPPRGYWAQATLGEALLLQGKADDALGAFANADREADASDGHRSSTRVQIRRVATHLGIDAQPFLGALPVGVAATFSGPLFRAERLDTQAQARLEAELRPQIDAAFAQHHVRYLFGALACGADIIAAEAALAAGIAFHAVLPFPVEDFVETSVAIGDSPEAEGRWQERFWQCLRRSESLTTLVERPPETRQLDSYYFHAFKLAAGLALMRADALSSHAVMIAVDNGQAAGSIAGTAVAARDWAATGAPLVRLALPMESSSNHAEPQADPFRPTIFTWPVGEPIDLAATAKRAAKASGIPLNPLPRSSRDRRTGAALVLDSIEAALRVLPALLQAASAEREPLRVIADFGAVADARAKPSEARLSRLAGASDLIGLPPGIAIATRTFAARARAEPGKALVTVPIGRTAAGGPDKGGDGRPLPSREVYALSFASDATSDKPAS